jgi:hypothetical protein
MSDPRNDGRTDEGAIDEDRDISDVGLAHPGDHVGTDETGSAGAGGSDAEEAALDEVFPAAEG